MSHTSLFNQPDEDLYISLLGGNIPSMKEDETTEKDNFVTTVATAGFMKIILNVLH